MISGAINSLAPGGEGEGLVERLDGRDGLGICDSVGVTVGSTIRRSIPRGVDFSTTNTRPLELEHVMHSPVSWKASSCHTGGRRLRETQGLR